MKRCPPHVILTSWIITRPFKISRSTSQFSVILFMGLLSFSVKMIRPSFPCELPIESNHKYTHSVSVENKLTDTHKLTKKLSLSDCCKKIYILLSAKRPSMKEVSHP